MVESTCSSSIHPVIQTRIIILWTELFPKKRREKIQGENFNLLRVQWCFHKYYKNYSNSTRITRFLRIQCILQCFHTQSSHPVLETNSSTRILQEILQLQGSSRVIPCRSVQGSFQQLFPVSPSTPHGRLQLLQALPTAFQGHTVQAGFQ